MRVAVAKYVNSGQASSASAAVLLLLGNHILPFAERFDVNTYVMKWTVGGGAGRDGAIFNGSCFSLIMILHERCIQSCF